LAITPSGAGTCKAVRKAPSARASLGCGGAKAALSPSNHGTTVQGQGNRTLGTPTITGTGTGSGSRGPRVGSQRCSWRCRSTATARRVSRTASASPSRHTALSHPSFTHHRQTSQLRSLLLEKADYQTLVDLGRRAAHSGHGSMLPCGDLHKKRFSAFEGTCGTRSCRARDRERPVAARGSLFEGIEPLG